MTPSESAVPDLLRQLERLERAIRHREPPPAGVEPFRHQPGSVPLLVTAPHGTAHLREGRPKREEEYTGALARLLAREASAHALYMTHRSDDDSNWERETPFKHKLRGIVAEGGIGFVLDLHGMTSRHRVGLALGTMNGESCPAHEARLCAALDASGFRRVARAEAGRARAPRWDWYLVNPPRFTGGLRHDTVTRFAARELGVPAAQLEISFANLIVQRAGNADHAPYRGNPAAIAHTTRALIALVGTLGSALARD